RLYHSPSLDEESAHSGERLSAVAHSLLLLVGDLAERAAERWIEEHGVVAEAAAPARPLRDYPLHDALDHLLAARRPRQRDHAAKARRPAGQRHVAEPLEQELPTLPVAEARAAEPRRVEPGRTAERVHLEPGVVTERQRARQPSRSAGLHEGVFGVGPARLLRKLSARKLGEQLDLEGHGAQQRQELAALVGIERR